MAFSPLNAKSFEELKVALYDLIPNSKPIEIPVLAVPSDQQGEIGASDRDLLEDRLYGRIFSSTLLR